MGLCGLLPLCHLVDMVQNKFYKELSNIVLKLYFWSYLFLSPVLGQLDSEFTNTEFFPGLLSVVLPSY